MVYVMRRPLATNIALAPHDRRERFRRDEERELALPISYSLINWTMHDDHVASVIEHQHKAGRHCLEPCTVESTQPNRRDL